MKRVLQENSAKMQAVLKIKVILQVINKNCEFNCVKRDTIMPRVLRSQSHRSHCRAASIIQAATRRPRDGAVTRARRGDEAMDLLTEAPKGHLQLSLQQPLPARIVGVGPTTETLSILCSNHHSRNIWSQSWIWSICSE